MKTYFLQVKNVKKETEDAVTIEFWHPLSEQIKYKAGQFITLMVPADGGKKVRRSYSMSTSPHTDTSVGVTVKRVKGGLVSNYLLDEVKKGDFIEVIEPMGRFVFEPDAEKERHIVLIGAGSGVTPLMSIAKSALKMEPKSKVTMLYGNRNPESIIFWEELLEMERVYMGRFNVTHILSQAPKDWARERGRIHQANAVLFLKEEHDVHFKDEIFYLCGPEGMMDEMEKVFKIYNLGPDQVHREHFNAPMLDEDLAADDTDESLKEQTVKVFYEGEEHNFLVKPHQTILEAALELDIDLPYSCQAGMCTACLGKCTSGKVKLDEEDGLTENELKDGLVLTCVAHPASAGVVIEIE
ncbi:ring-1,2-phenylacetyl-CoA epoxidase subunit PaaE [Spirosomataceae bacterium TFI 002]|nr:ring-1,2-phenylacetyl-CoA epoxidase subunit PaaE [Spirosomataceae bacterium TFI 002]